MLIVNEWLSYGLPLIASGPTVTYKLGVDIKVIKLLIQGYRHGTKFAEIALYTARNHNYTGETYCKPCKGGAYM